MIAVFDRPPQSLADAFAIANDFDGRKAKGKEHPLQEILVCVLVGNLSGHEGYRASAGFLRPPIPEEATEEFKKICRKKGEAALACLRKYLPFPNGVPSYSCMSRAMASVDNEGLSVYICDLFYSLIPMDVKRQWAIDGKALRAAINKALTGKSNYIINLLDVGSQIVLYSFSVGSKTNEASRLTQELSALLHGVNCLITTDAMGTKPEITQQVIAAGCDYALPLKKNNRRIMEMVGSVLESLSIEFSPLISSCVDLEKHTDDDIPGLIIENPLVELKDEDNENTDDPVTPARPVADHCFFDKLYNYTQAESDADGKLCLPAVNPAENPDLAYFLLGDRWVRMAKNQDRYERREYECCSDPAIVSSIAAAFPQFAGIKSIGTVTRYRAELQRVNKVTVWVVTITRTPVICSMKTDAVEMSNIFRNHWQVEAYHWALDEVLREDRCTTRTGYAPENCSFLRKTALNFTQLLQRYFTKPDADKLVDRVDIRRILEDLSICLKYIFTPLQELNAPNPFR